MKRADPRACGAFHFLRAGFSWRIISLWFCVVMLSVTSLRAEPEPEGDSGEAMMAPAASVQVERQVSDEAIARRLARIYEATQWYTDSSVRVDQGVVFIRGKTDRENHRNWAATVANKTEGVVAVVNRIEVTRRSMWDLSEAGQTILELIREAIQRSPLILFAMLMLALSASLAVGISRGSQSLFRHWVRTSLLRTVAAKIVASAVFLLGLYMVLRVAGLERLAVTVLGGTGIAGLVIGFAFRDIAENFLASVLMSLQRPFARGDLIEVAGFRGFVQQLNARSTLLMTPQGNHVQIPNATIYNNPIINFTANPRVRGDFLVGISYDSSTIRAQKLGLELLQKHEAILPQPEPLVLVEALDASTVNLRFLFWINSQLHGLDKVRSSLLRQVKRTFQDARIVLPDPNREVLFPQPVPLQVQSRIHMRESTPADAPQPSTIDEEGATSSPGEGHLQSEADTINEQARHTRKPEEGIDLLDD